MGQENWVKERLAEGLGLSQPIAARYWQPDKYGLFLERQSKASDCFDDFLLVLAWASLNEAPWKDPHQV